MKQFSLILTFLCFLCASSTAQLPKTEVFSFNYSSAKKGKINVSSPKLLSFDNKSGYNNQPAFINDDIYISQSSFLGGKQQTDIVALNTTAKTKSIVTKTKSSEYSPTAHPDGKHFTVIQAREDGKQFLVKYQLDRKGKGEILFENKTNIGYHCWLSANKVALFLVDESKGHHLVIGDVTTGATKHVAFNVGRCIKKSQSGNLIYLDKEIDGNWKLKTVLTNTGQTLLLGQILEGEEDFEILPDGYIITGHQGSIYKLIPEKGSEWVPIVSLKKFVKTKKITRIAVKGNKLVVVAE